MYIRQYKYVYLYTYIEYTHTVYLKDAPEPNNITCFFFQIFPYGHDPFAGCNTHTHILLTRTQTNFQAVDNILSCCAPMPLVRTR